MVKDDSHCVDELHVDLAVQSDQLECDDMDNENVELFDLFVQTDGLSDGLPVTVDGPGDSLEHVDLCSEEGVVLTQLDSVSLGLGDEQCENLDGPIDNTIIACSKFTDDLKTYEHTVFNANMLEIYHRVFSTGTYNYQCAKIPIPSGLNVDAWEHYLVDYGDREIVDFLRFGWPSSFDHHSPYLSTLKNYSSGLSYPKHIEHYIEKELSKQALLGPFSYPPIIPLHVSPILTRPKKIVNGDALWLTCLGPEGSLLMTE